MNRLHTGIHIYVVLACVTAIVIDVTMALTMNEKSLLSTTISNLAAGDFDAAQDTGLIMVAIGVVLTGVVVWREFKPNWINRSAAGLFAVAGLCTVLLALYEAYSKVSPSLPKLHDWATWGLGFCFAGALALIAYEHGKGRLFFRILTLLAALVFLAAGAATAGVNDGIVGLVERFSIAGMLLWLIFFHAERLWDPM